MTNLSEGAYAFTSDKGTFHNRFTLQFEEELVLGTNDKSLDAVSIFPNPTSGIVNVVSPLDPITTITVMDLRGRLISTTEYNNQNTIQLDINNLTSSIYFIKLSTAGGNSITKRVVKR